MMYAKALLIRCPVCDRKPGYPCQKLSGMTSSRMWIEDTEKGGWVGYSDCQYPHKERIAAATGRFQPRSAFSTKGYNLW